MLPLPGDFQPCRTCPFILLVVPPSDTPRYWLSGAREWGLQGRDLGDLRSHRIGALLCCEKPSAISSV